jgi:hypothetical protein
VEKEEYLESGGRNDDNIGFSPKELLEGAADRIPNRRELEVGTSIMGQRIERYGRSLGEKVTSLNREYLDSNRVRRKIGVKGLQLELWLKDKTSYWQKK